MSTFTDREARLASTLVNVLMTAMCDPQRLSRGRTYYRQGTVTDLAVESGSLTGQVHGGRPEPYQVTVRVSPADQRGNLAGLVPTSRDLVFECTCPDWDSPCKHSVAVMSGFAEMISNEPPLLATWRGVNDTPSAARAAVGSRANRTVTEPAPPAPAAVLTDDAREALQQFLGDSFRFEPPALTTLPPPRADDWDDPWASMLDDALSHLEQTPRHG